ncbi:hypothetical protein [Labrys wisconsinensis]|uniref:Peptidoglycan binding-like domain-containing protein n=1 Tax=Labrys wisconsinensis TaxID=425677 RepID=A0ABU0J8U8_9HYPH|nr:hypothetical protein [Labrys wisconsinensis]MDQ0469679.1 hypothetical protein [Labrys wisconsinensis]
MWRGLVVAFSVALALASPVRAGNLPGYDEAKQAYEALDVESRLQVDVLLLVAGYGSIVGEVFSEGIFEDISKFQAASGLPVTGILGKADIDRLIELTSPVLANLKLEAVNLFDGKMTMWVPSGLRFQRIVKDGGTYYDSEIAKFLVKIAKNEDFDFNDFVDSFDVERPQDKKLKARYRDRTDNSFVMLCDIGKYTMNYWVYPKGSGFVLMEFVYEWNNPNVNANRLELLMVQSLWGSLEGGTPLSLPTQASLHRLKAQVAEREAMLAARPPPSFPLPPLPRLPLVPLPSSDPSASP